MQRTAPGNLRAAADAECVSPTDRTIHDRVGFQRKHGTPDRANRSQHGFEMCSSGARPRFGAAKVAWPNLNQKFAERPMGGVAMQGIRYHVAASVSAAALLIGAAPAFSAQNQALDASLKGLTSVSVHIDDIDADAEGDGLSKAQLQTLVELRLRQAGISLVPEAPPDGPRGYLWVAITVKKLRNDVNYILSIETRLARLVRIVGSDQTTSALTWFTPGNAAITPTAELVQHVREVLVAQVELFANAYLAMNPKR